MINIHHTDNKVDHLRDSPKADLNKKSDYGWEQTIPMFNFSLAIIINHRQT